MLTEALQISGKNKDYSIRDWEIKVFGKKTKLTHNLTVLSSIIQFKYINWQNEKNQSF